MARRVKRLPKAPKTATTKQLFEIKFKHNQDKGCSELLDHYCLQGREGGQGRQGVRVDRG